MKIFAPALTGLSFERTPEERVTVRVRVRVRVSEL